MDTDIAVWKTRRLFSALFDNTIDLVTDSIMESESGLGWKGP